MKKITIDMESAPLRTSGRGLEGEWTLSEEVEHTFWWTHRTRLDLNAMVVRAHIREGLFTVLP